MKKIILGILCLITVLGNAQTFNIQTNLNLQLSRDTTLHPFTGGSVTTIGVSGHVRFTSEMGFVRFVVSDANEEYLVYETYRLFENDSILDFVHKCDESCFFDSFIPANLEIQVKDALVTLSYLETGNTPYSNAEEQRKNAANLANSQRLSRVQSYIQSKGLIWKASLTKLSSLSYKQKKNLWGSGYKSYGYEYYSSGFYSLFGPSRYSSCRNIVSDFDWRSRHGSNLPLSPYYDNDAMGTGWITPVVCQSEGCWINDSFDCYLNEMECTLLGGEYREEAPTCWIFGPSAQVEAMTNLYYNQHVDVDVSEQYILCRTGAVSSGQPSNALSYYKNDGVPLESCLPYSASLENCDDLCADSSNRVQIAAYTTYNQYQLNDSLLKQKLIHEGPLTASSLPLGFGLNHHCMTLVGWGTIDNRIVSEVLGVPLDSNGAYDPGFIGLTYWIYKESLGTDVGENGFKYILHINNDVPQTTISISTPITYMDWGEDDVACNDMDGDGYYYWGIGPKPSHCPPCPNEPDGDDSNPNLGPMNNYGQCSIIGTYTAGFEDDWDNWMQPNQNNDGLFWRHSGPTSAGLTGPSEAQEGDYYLCVNSRILQNYNHSLSIIESPDISINDACGILLDFYYHMKIYDWNSGEENPYIKLSTLKPNGVWSITYPSWSAKGDHGSEWQHVSILLPPDVKKVRFYVKTGNYQYSDIAIDNITISPWIHNPAPIIINGSDEWNSNQSINQDIIINDGGILTIRKTGVNNVQIKMNEDSKIIVKPGGRLILDGCTITTVCNDIWPGIEVWGDSEAHQQEVDGGYLQGYVELKNGATIENARCAIRLYNPLEGGTSGGIVHAADAVFRNNARAVDASHYTNHGTLSQRERDYNGWFRNCRFTVDDNYLGQAAFHSHVALTDVNGISFYGCSFSADRSVDSVDFLCAGIAAYDASFKVAEYCDSPMLPCPSSSLTRSSFSGFHRGVGSVNDGQSTRTFSVKDSDFSGNDIGVFALNTSMAIVVDDSFDVGGLTDCAYGVYLEGVSMCRIEENAFTKVQGTDSETYGVAIKDSRAANDVYRNEFHSLSCGNIAIGANATVTQSGGVPSVTTGLTYTCNDNSANIVDFRIVDGGDLSGIQPIQGSTTIAAGNTFGGSDWHIHNDGDYPLSYYYNAMETDQIPASAKLRGVSSIASSGGNRCLSHYGDSPVKQSQSGIDSLAGRWAEAREAYETLRKAYEAQAEGWMADSDNAVAQRLLAEMNEKAHEATEAAGDIVRSLANDPGSDASVLRRWLSVFECPEADRIAVASLLEQGDTEGALSMTVAMADKYDPKRLDPVEHNDYLRLVKLYAELRQSGRTSFELTDDELRLVERISVEGASQARTMAMALLEGTDRGHGLTLCPAEIIDEYRDLFEGMERHSNGLSNETPSELIVSIVPSPAKNRAAIYYSLPQGHSRAVLELHNIVGIKVMSMELDGNGNSVSIDLSALPGGVYLYTVRCGEKTQKGNVVISN